MLKSGSIPASIISVRFPTPAPCRKFSLATIVAYPSWAMEVDIAELYVGRMSTHFCNSKPLESPQKNLHKMERCRA